LQDLIDNSIKNGLSHEEAQRIAKQHFAKSIQLRIKKWIPEEKLPKRLHLLCTVSSYEVKRGNYIEITSLRKINDSDVELTLSVYPYLKDTEYLYLDLKPLTHRR